MLWPLLISALGFTCYFAAVMLTRARAEVLRRERTGAWIAEAVGK
jgi:heme exporter protein C